MKKFLPKNSFLFLPISLAILFVAQNQIFNIFVGLHDSPFFFLFILSTFSLGILFYGPSVLFSKWWRYVYLFIISSFVAWLFLAQYLYFSYFGGFMQASALKYSGQTTSLAGSILNLVSFSLIIFLLQFVVLFIGIFLQKKEKIIDTLPLGGFTAKWKNLRVFYLLCIIIIGLFGYGVILFGNGNGWYKITHFPQTIREMNSFVYSPNMTVQRIGIFNYFAADFIGMTLRSTKLTPEDIALVLEWKDAVPKIGKTNTFGSAKNKNLIIIQVESLENSVLFQKINGQEITPNLNILAKHGLYINNYYTQVGAGNTADAEFVILNSLYSLTNTVAFIDFAHNKYHALPSLLKENGYRTYSLHADEPTFWNRSNIYPALGYEKSFSKSDFVLPVPMKTEYLPDSDFFAQSLQEMTGFQSPFMATLITLSSHTPFKIPTNLQTLSIPEKSPFNAIQKDYLQSIHYTDMAIGEFIAGLKVNGLYNNSVIAIYGDHGNLYGISDLIGTSTTKAFKETRSSNVPLILLGTNLPAKTYSTPGSHLDFYPTVENILGITSTSTLFGKDLLGKTHRVTLRNAYSKAITTILTGNLTYKNFTDGGLFENGECLSMSKQTVLPIEDCKTLYEEEVKATSASDLIIKGNLELKLSSSQTLKP